MIYQYSGCCGEHVWERVCRLAEYIEHPEYCCPRCGGELRRIISAPRLLLGGKPFEPFRSPVDGSIITSKHDLAEHNKRNNVVNVHDGYDEAAVQQMIHKDHQKPLDEERAKDLKQDAMKAVEKLQSGYAPQPVKEEIIP